MTVEIPPQIRTRAFQHVMRCHVVSVGRDTEIEPAWVVCSCGFYIEIGRFGVQQGEPGGLAAVMRLYAEHLASPRQGTSETQS